MEKEEKNYRSNLFNVDIDGLEDILAEVHEELIQDTSNLNDKFSELPAEFSSSKDIENATAIVKEIDILAKKWRETRLKDLKPFKSAEKRGSDWFKDYENPVKDKKISVNKRLNEYLKKERERQELESEVELEEEEVESEEEFVEMVQSAANEEELDELISSSNQEVISEVPTKYEVRGFNRKKLPMEQLEPYFTDHQLKAAINKHMNERGPTLNGVDYEEVVNL